MLFFKYEKNKRLKRLSIFGFIILLVGIFAPKLDRFIYERDRYLDLVLDDNINNIDLNLEFDKILDLLKINNIPKVREFLLNYDKYGKINSLKIDLIEENNNEKVNYIIEYLPSESRCYVKKSILDYCDNNQYMYLNNFLDGIMILKNIKLKIDSDLYEIKCSDASYMCREINDSNIKGVSIYGKKGVYDLYKEYEYLNGIIINHYGYDDEIINEDGMIIRPFSTKVRVEYIMYM